MKRIYNSRWIMTLVGLVIPILNHIFGWEIPTEEMVAMAGVIAAFVLGESWRKAKNGILRARE